MLASIVDVHRHTLPLDGTHDEGMQRIPEAIQRRRPRTVRLWGPVSAEDGASCGAITAASSVLLGIELEPGLREAVLALLPKDVLPCRLDTKATLQERLGKTVWLDAIHFLKKGHGPGYPPLNRTSQSQPRRVTWSVILKDAEEDVDGDVVVQLFAYHTMFGREPTDMCCRPMPMAVFDLGLALWRSAWPYLGIRSQAHPPGHCQGLFCKPPTSHTHTHLPAPTHPPSQPISPCCGWCAQTTHCSILQWGAIVTIFLLKKLLRRLQKRGRTCCRSL